MRKIVWCGNLNEINTCQLLCPTAVTLRASFGEKYIKEKLENFEWDGNSVLILDSSMLTGWRVEVLATHMFLTAFPTDSATHLQALGRTLR